MVIADLAKKRRRSWSIAPVMTHIKPDSRRRINETKVSTATSLNLHGDEPNLYQGLMDDCALRVHAS